jgi:hypothetical protein
MCSVLAFGKSQGAVTTLANAVHEDYDRSDGGAFWHHCHKDYIIASWT